MQVYLKLLCFISLCFPAFLQAQQKAVQYTPDFEFKEGVYLSVDDFKNNAPIPPSKIVFNSNKNDKDFLKYVMNKSTFTYIDTAGKEQQLKTDKVWGYSSNGVFYINHGTDFNRVTVIGSICHFVATVPMRVSNPDPFYYNQPFGDREQYMYISEQLILDLESGKVMAFSVDNMEGLLSRDEALHKEFAELKKKKKRDMIFVYLRKYNEKHPVYFPE
jgi:hypothetical protein